MARRMLINAIHPEECRVAIADGDHLLELEVERADSNQQKGNIFKAEITRIEPSLQAAFLDIGSSRNGFLQINDIHPTYFRNWPPEESERNGRYRPPIQEVLRAGQHLVVQVVKDERDAKGATLTTNLSIPGRYLVMMVGNQRGGVSRKIVDENQRRRLRQSVESLEIPPGMGVIVRTAGINKSTTELQGDLDALLEVWEDIIVQSVDAGTPRLLYQESDVAFRTIRDYFSKDIDQILIDEPKLFERAKQFVSKIMPDCMDRVVFHEGPRPLFSAFHLDKEIEAINQPEVTLPSGGSIVINVTEAVVAIDVNSGRATGQSDVEETAFETNKEAARVIAEQLRLRDLGGLIVVDFIDMIDRRHKQTVERTLKDAVRFDKAKVEVGRISKFGLLEMSRQRMKSSLVSQSSEVCPHCAGRGRIKAATCVALEALAKLQSAAFAGGIRQARLRMAPGPALILLNNKRRMLSELEAHTKVDVLIYADGRMRPDEYALELETNKQDGMPANNSFEDDDAPRERQRRTASRRPGGKRERDNRVRGRRGGGNNRRRSSRRSEEGDSRDNRDSREPRERRSSGDRRSSRPRSRRDDAPQGNQEQSKETPSEKKSEPEVAVASSEKVGNDRPQNEI